MSEIFKFNKALNDYLVKLEDDEKKALGGLSFIGMSTKFENQFVSNFASYLNKEYNKGDKARFFKLQYTDKDIKRADLVILKKNNNDTLEPEILIEFKVWHVYDLDKEKLKNYIGIEKIGLDCYKHKDYKGEKLFVLVCLESYNENTKIPKKYEKIIANYPGLDLLFKDKKKELGYNKVKKRLDNIFKKPFEIEINKKNGEKIIAEIDLKMEKGLSKEVLLGDYLEVKNKLYCFVFKEKQK